MLHYIRNANGNVRVLIANEDNVKVIAKGQGAFGDAGRIGTWDDLLLKSSPDTVFRVKPSRGEAYFLHVLQDKIVKLNISESEIYGAEIPTDLDKYVRL